MEDLSDAFENVFHPDCAVVAEVGKGHVLDRRAAAGADCPGEETVPRDLTGHGAAVHLVNEAVRGEQLHVVRVGQGRLVNAKATGREGALQFAQDTETARLVRVDHGDARDLELVRERGRPGDRLDVITRFGLELARADEDSGSLVHRRGKNPRGEIDRVGRRDEFHFFQKSFWSIVPTRGGQARVGETIPSASARIST